MMNSVNKTLYIPLYGKAYVSGKGLFLTDSKAEEIWAAEQFPLGGKSKSKWLAYYMGIRSAVFDGWTRAQIAAADDATVLHIGCGMDSRALRAGECAHMWYDLDFPEVIAERARYFNETERYRMLPCDLRRDGWLTQIPQSKKAIVIMEGVSMYLSPEELRSVFVTVSDRFDEVALLMDCYSTLAAKMSKYKNPINDVGVTAVYGTDDPRAPEAGGLLYLGEHDMTPKRYIDELHGMEKRIFAGLYAGGFAKKLYRLYEYKKDFK